MKYVAIQGTRATLLTPVRVIYEHGGRTVCFDLVNANKRNINIKEASMKKKKKIKRKTSPLERLYDTSVARTISTYNSVVFVL